MVDYQIFINALRKCAKEHENDITPTGHIVVSALCKDTANLLEDLEQEPILDQISAETTKGETTTQENLLQTLFDLEAENERLHDALDKIVAEISELKGTFPSEYYLAIIYKYRKEQT